MGLLEGPPICFAYWLRWVVLLGLVVVGELCCSVLPYLANAVQTRCQHAAERGQGVPTDGEGRKEGHCVCDRPGGCAEGNGLGVGVANRWVVDL